MKKMLVLLLALILIAPVMGWACACCPSAANDFSQQPVFKAGHHDCCANANAEFSSCEQLNAPKFVLTNPVENFITSLLFRALKGAGHFLKLSDDSSSPENIRQAFLVDFLPPPVEPLYLTNQVFLI